MSADLYDDDSTTKFNIFKSYVDTLMLALYRHSQLDTDHGQELLEESDDLFDFRCGVQDCVKDVAFISSGECIFKAMLSQLEQATCWQQAEAALFIMYSIARNLPPDDNVLVPSVVEYIVRLSTDSHVCLRNTALQLLGELWEWLECHAEQYLERALHWLMEQLTNNACLSRTVEDTLDLWNDRKHHEFQAVMARNIDRMAALALQLNARSEYDHGIEALLKASSAALRTINDAEAISQRIEAMCAPQLNKLRAIIDAGDANASTSSDKENGISATSPVAPLSRLAAIFRPLSAHATPQTSAPWLSTVEKLWPTLLEIMRRYENERRVIEYCTRTVRLVVRSLGRQSLPFVEPLANAMVETYTRHSEHSCILYLASILIDEYGALENFHAGLIQTAQVLFHLFFFFIQMHNLAGACNTDFRSAQRGPR